MSILGSYVGRLCRIDVFEYTRLPVANVKGALDYDAIKQNQQE